MNRITRPIDLQTFRVLATWTLFESEFWPNRFKRLGIRPIQSENFRLRGGGRPLDVRRPADRHLEVRHKAVGKGINPTVDRKVLAARPGLLHENVGGDVAHLPDDVELAQAVEAGAQIR